MIDKYGNIKLKMRSVRMKQLKFILPAIVLLLSACGETPKEKSNEAPKTEVKKSEQNVNENTTETKQETKDTEQVKDTAQVKQTHLVAYKASSKSTIKQLMEKMPASYRAKNYNVIKSFIKSGSEADKYIQQKLKTNAYDDYQIKSYSIQSITEDDNHNVHVTVSRTINSNGTNHIDNKVVTVYDLSYNKKTDKMEVYDFNDKKVEVIHAASSPQNEQTKQPTDNASGEVTNINEAIEMVNDKHMKRLKQENPDKSVILVAGNDEEDAGGAYFKVKAIDKNSKYLIQTFKVYKHNGLLVGE